MVKKTNVLMIMLVFFLVIADLALTIVTAHAETKDIQLLEENGLKLSYLAEENQWRLNFERQSDEKHQQRLKIRLTDENDRMIKYPAESGMIENGGWLIEEKFSVQQADQLTFEIPESIKKLQLYVQMDQQDTTNQESSIQEDILEPITFAIDINWGIRVANTKVREGTLPNTGFYGVHKYYVAAGIFITIGILLSGAYVYYNRKQ